MDKELLKQIGAVIIVMLIGWTGILLIGLGTLQISAGLLFAISITIIGILVILYLIISYFTGAKLSDVKQLALLVEKLLDVFDTLKKGDQKSDSTESTTS